MNKILELDRDHAVERFPTSPQVKRENISRARQAAEALFAHKPVIAPVKQTASPATQTASGPAERVPRTPRILRAIEAQPVPVIEATAPKRRELAEARQIPASHFARIQVWMEYGMTVRQVAQVYGVKVCDINRILETA